ncbi:MAG: DUF885 family protein [Sphingomonas sp.]|uniref:DUF885 family protein n=1 Tax=Sphingomonas sp. TaxID=28214 RepID=UPI0017D39E1F|nr:DUF885 family protein [Sphingomonas sp.]MBA3666480.1 DUF885 family protein [Sphingomonas sp.]
MHRLSILLIAAAIAATSSPATAAQPPAPAAAVPAHHAELVRLFADWRRFVSPTIHDGVPDYSRASMARKAAALPSWRARLARTDRRGWSPAALNDYRLVEAEMNGLDFFLRVLKPWSRDPGFYQTIFAEESDVPAHEGPSAEPNIDLFKFSFPLSPADDARLTTLVGAVPAMLTSARVNLAPSQAHDLWAYGPQAFNEQAEMLAALESGTLVIKSLEGKRGASLDGASPALRAAVRAARLATEQFASWIKAEAPRRTGPSGVGKSNYDWYLAHVELNPDSWEEQVVLLQRELDRSLASLRLEELRNRAAPPIAEIRDPAAYRRMVEARTQKLNDFLVATGFVPDQPYFRAALAAQAGNYTPPDKRNFFTHITALDPLPLSSHSTHWIELARLKHEPHASPIRRVAPLFNLFADRSEGFATAMEELVMQAGLYDDIPHGRELVWIMLANRAARGLASLRVQANQMTLDQAGQFHAHWTPRGYSDASSRLVGFEQLLYLRQPGYGPSYIIGKLQLDELLAIASHQAEVEHRPFVMGDAFARIIGAGIIPPALIKAELGGEAVR